MDVLRGWLEGLGLGESQVGWVVQGLAVLALIVAAVIADLVAKRILLTVVKRVARKTRTDWDDALVEKKFFHRLAHLAPALIIWGMAPVVWDGAPAVAAVVRQIAQIYILLAGMGAAFALLNAVDTIYQSYDVARRVPITGYVQVFKLILSLAAAIIAISMLLDKSPLVLLSGIGAATAIIMLIFKDTILGFVGGIQLAANDMVRPGDWIAMPKFGADGDVIEVGLNSVKVRNWDKTVTTIPTYAMISDSFKNWRGMEESGGRRIKRSIHIDVRSIRFCTPEMIERFSRIQKLAGYIERKQRELVDYNSEQGIDESVLVNGRRMTNIGTFRAYLVAYLKDHPQVHQDMTFLVRQLAPTDKGLPLEIYVFSKDQAWANYEAIQADIFDHIFASVHEFDLRPFQRPTGYDLAEGYAGLVPD